MFPTHAYLFPWRLTSGTPWACKTCGQDAQLILARCADMRLQCYAGPVDNTQGTAIVPGNSIGQYHTMDQAQCGR
jgi:hypothetical protein